MLDLAGYPKDRTFWYASWFLPRNPAAPVLHLFPHWDWNTAPQPLPNGAIDVWAFSNADEVELLVNGVSFGRQAMPQFGHVAWPAVPFAPGGIEARAYINGSSAPAAVAWRNTTGPASKLAISIKDGVGAPALLAGCDDAAVISVAVVDAAGVTVRTSSPTITFSVSGPATYAGAATGDPADTVTSIATSKPAFHGLITAVVKGGDTSGTVTVTASSPGFAPVSLQIPQVQPAAGQEPFWCRSEARL